MSRQVQALALALSAAWVCNAADDAKSENHTQTYEAPAVDGLHWAETFDGNVWSRWSKSGHEKYTGDFKVDVRDTESLVGDVGLLVPEEAKHYGSAVLFPPLEGKKDTPFVVQFEVRFQNGLTCGGSYIKLFDSEGKTAADFKDDTRYVIMFGPDRCGATNKVHFILQHKSPKTGKWEEKHCKDAPAAPHDLLTHLYTLIIKPDNTFEIQIDGEKKTSGNLLNTMEPPVNPPKEIDDPEDSKPGDWADEAKIDDPASSKPDDWDEDAPRQIDDPKASKPSGWNDDAEKKIPDPDAKVPADWDEEEDGEWEAPIIDNPACKVGCGKWEPPKISNPKYKGKWAAPKIDNPVYKGVWKPKQIANPDYFLDESPAVLPKIDGVGIDIWTMSKGLMFDNIVISTDVAAAKAFADSTFAVKKGIELLQNKPVSSSSGMTQYWIAAAVTGVIVLLTTLWFCCRSGSSAARAPAPRRGAAPATAGEAAPAEAAPQAEEKEEAAGAESEKKEEADVKEEAEKKEEAAGEEKEAAEGGLGDLGKED